MPIDVQGTCEPRFKKVQEAFVRNFEERDEVGAAVALTVDGPTLTATIDGRQTGSATDDDPHYATGLAGIEAGATAAAGAWTGTSWPIVQYRHLAVTP